MMKKKSDPLFFLARGPKWPKSRNYGYYRHTVKIFLSTGTRDIANDEMKWPSVLIGKENQSQNYGSHFSVILGQFEPS